MPRTYKPRMTLEQKRESRRLASKKWRERNPGRLEPEQGDKVHVPERVRLEAERRRELEPRILGDPLPGYSALDRKRQEETCP